VKNMCGIIGYIGDKNAIEIVCYGLKKVEYRGYDSAGIAFEENNQIKLIKDVGTIINIIPEDAKNHSKKAIGHTRWATHGPPCKENAHPHLDCTKKIAIIHNGIIENYLSLKEELIKKGHRFESETDSEVLAHLIEEELKKEKNSFEAVKKAIKKIEGSFAFGIMIANENKLFVARKYAPLIIGIGENEMFFASDIPAILRYTKKIIVLEDGDIAQIQKDGLKIYNSDHEVKREIVKIDWDEEMAQKQGFEHFMLKEIFEQDQAVANALGAELSQAPQMIKNAKKIALIGCGTSYYASLVLEYFLKRNKKNVCSYISSEYENWSAQDEDLIIAISQSGETADTLKVVRKAKQRGAKIISIINVIGSSLARLSDCTINIGAGPEISVVATKTFLAELVVLYRLAYLLNGQNEKIKKMRQLRQILKEFIKEKDLEIKKIALALENQKDFLFIARGLGYVCALEGALKLKEITYLHAEAYAAGELKHGPISMIEKNIPVIVIGQNDSNIKNLHSNIKECKARGANTIILSEVKELLDEADIKIKIPNFDDEMFLILYIIPLQLLAYYIATKQGKDPDKPRNLAKSVTVE